jgi:glutamate-ammonia-ligase adenylyltransferase
MNAIWAKAIRASADPRQARHFYDLLSAARPNPEISKCSLEEARVFAALFSGSKSLSTLLVARQEWMPVVSLENLAQPRSKHGLRAEVRRWAAPMLKSRDWASVLAGIRGFKSREMLRVAARDLSRPGNAQEIVREISDLADVCLEVVWDVCFRQLGERFGQPFHRDAKGRWQSTPGGVLGLGKLGGRELNYSSDVDVMFIYSDEGNVYREAPAPGSEPPAVLTNHKFFNRVAEAFIAEVTQLAPEGMLYRMDVRLRPEGDQGPLTRSLAGCENYYAQWGQTWERMMLIKARGVAGNAALAGEFIEIIQPFRYARSLTGGVLVEVAQMKQRIENEIVRTGELHRNVKLGRGGIREIEFIAQSIQVLHAGRQPFLQSADSLETLAKLRQYELLPSRDVQRLDAAYRFLRDVEHRLQMQDNLQTHTIPTDERSRRRLARLMGFSTWNTFSTALNRHTRAVRRIFDGVLCAETGDSPGKDAFPRRFAEEKSLWLDILTQHSFRDPEKAFRMLQEFVEGPGFGHVSARTKERAHQLLPRMFGLCIKRSGKAHVSMSSLALTGETRAVVVLSDPDRVVTRLDNFIAAYGARATLFELWNTHPILFDMLLLLFDRSEFLAEAAIRTPDLVDELVTGERLRLQKRAEETLRDLRHGLADEDQHKWLRQYHQAEQMRIGLRDILGLATNEQCMVELSALADACLEYALEIACRSHQFRKTPLAIIGLGKLGGEEIDYGSDLDIVFVAPGNSGSMARLAPVAVAVMDLLSRRTEHGLVFHTDARLRPDGEKGLLVNSLDSCMEYYQRRGQLWELQTLTRARFICGDRSTGEEFIELASHLTNFSRGAAEAAAFSSDWRSRIHQMRLRIEKERTPSGKGDLAFKTGRGGLIDAEFVAQALCLEHGWHEPNTYRVLERARESGALPDAENLIPGYLLLRRVEGILRRWSYEGESVLPDDPAAYLRVAVRCGYQTSEEFHRSMTAAREGIRRVYCRVFDVAL